MDVPRLILASASPRRRDVLVQLGLRPEIVPADVDETPRPGERPEALVERLARAKAETVAKVQAVATPETVAKPEAVASPPDPTAASLVVGGDTMVVDGDRLLSKPDDEEHAVRMLCALAGGDHEVLSGLAVTSGGRTESLVTRTTVRMRAFDEDTARRYVSTGEPLDKAGGYGIQGMGAALVEAIDGDYFSVVGFPVAGFVALVERVGWRFAFGTLIPAAPEPSSSTSEP